MSHLGCEGRVINVRRKKCMIVIHYIQQIMHFGVTVKCSVLESCVLNGYLFLNMGILYGFIKG